tara:strand:+ start:49 stop:249 length:201 start_codon:yes stop_codon:yes gene_type:complete
MKVNFSKLSAKLAVQSVATTIIIGKALVDAGSSFAKEVKNEVVSRQSEPEQLELPLDNPNEKVEQA